MKIDSTETLDSAAGQHTRRFIALQAAITAMNKEVADVKKRHQSIIAGLNDEVAAEQAAIREYLEAHPESLGDKKSRETPMSRFGFRQSTRLETANRKVTWGDVAERLQRYDWGEAYLSYKPPTVNKEAFHADRNTVPEQHLDRAGVRFVTEDEFWIEPKIETPEAAK